MSEKTTVYVIESTSDPRRYYIGLTSDLSKRLTAHNAGASRHTSKFGPWRCLVSMQFASQVQAVRFERYLKSHSGRAFVTRHFRETRVVIASSDATGRG